MKKPRIAVIGAGSSGLAATKQCLDDELEPVCFEQSSYTGGLWKYVDIDNTENKDPHSSIFKS
ncbi:1144_t:CDS:2, partial [Acaulospora morrowiae]